MHEIPQEIGDFGVLLHSGFKKTRALFLNFVVALTVVVGGVAGWILSGRVENITSWLLPVAAGGFIYIALSDLMPELRNQTSLKKFLINFVFLLLGIGLMWTVKFVGE